MTTKYYALAEAVLNSTTRAFNCIIICDTIADIPASVLQGDFIFVKSTNQQLLGGSDNQVNNPLATIDQLPSELDALRTKFNALLKAYVDQGFDIPCGLEEDYVSALEE